MSHANPPHPERAPAAAPSSAATRWVVSGFLVIAGFFLLTEHRAHLFGVLPYLLLLACPLLHVFHHRGHAGGHRDHPDRGEGGGS